MSKEEAPRPGASWSRIVPLSPFLCASLGDFMVPVGAPMLERTRLAEGKHRTQDYGRVRRLAGRLALANLGQNLKRFDKLDGPIKEAVLDHLRIALMGCRWR